MPYFASQMFCCLHSLTLVLQLYALSCAESSLPPQLFDINYLYLRVFVVGERGREGMESKVKSKGREGRARVGILKVINSLPS